MKFLRSLIIIPLVILAIWAICVADSSAEGIGFSLWPAEDDVKRILTLHTKPVLFICLLFGYLLGRLDAWFSYASLRAELRHQRKTNKELNKEQDKLNQTVSGLKHDIIGLQEKALKEIVAPKASDGTKSKWWSIFKKKSSSEKAN
ncbi:MAG: LapA family protein [Alphaproteobacteria bacterium]|nr:LapA family protein [Alphaproteobacteria bacterium]